MEIFKTFSKMAERVLKQGFLEENLEGTVNILELTALIRGSTHNEKMGVMASPAVISLQLDSNLPCSCCQVLFPLSCHLS